MIRNCGLKYIRPRGRLTRHFSTFPYAFGGRTPANDQFDQVLRQLFKDKYLTESDIPGFWKGYHTLLEAIQEDDKEFIQNVCTPQLASQLTEGLDTLTSSYNIDIKGEGVLKGDNRIKLCSAGFLLHLDSDLSKPPHWLIQGNVPLRLGIIGMSGMSFPGLMTGSQKAGGMRTSFEVILQIETDKNLQMIPKQEPSNKTMVTQQETHLVKFSILSEMGSVGLPQMAKVMMMKSSDPREQLAKLIQTLHGDRYNWLISGLDTNITN